MSLNLSTCKCDYCARLHDESQCPGCGAPYSGAGYLIEKRGYGADFAGSGPCFATVVASCVLPFTAPIQDWERERD